MPEPEYDTAKWWLRELTKRLAKRAPLLRKADDFYDGRHRMVFASQKFRQAFGGLFSRFADNWCGVVVDAVEERLHVEGFRFGDKPEADDDAWAMWQRNSLDADSGLLHTDMLTTGYGYGLVWADEDGQPLITIESPHECIVAHEPGSRRKRRAGLKMWRDDAGFLFACLYTPDELYKFRSASKNSELTMDAENIGVEWKPYHPREDDTWPLGHELGVPLVPIYNRPRTSKPGQGKSELDGVIEVQQAVDKLCVDLLVASEFGSFRQRYASGYEADEDDDGNEINPFKNIPGGVWTVGPPEGSNTAVQFGEFGETNLGNIVKAIEMFVQHLASQSRTPPHYLNASADRLSGESIKAAETGLVAKTRKQQRPTGEGWEEIERIGFKVKGDPRAERWDAETIWSDPEYRTESEHVDALVKLKDLGVPNEQLQEDAGYSPQQRARFKAMALQDQLEQLLAPAPPALTVRTGGPPQPPEPPQPQPAGQ